MALDIHAYAVTEPSAVSVAALAAPGTIAFSLGANFGADVPGAVGENNAGGLIVAVTVGGTDDFDIIIQSAVSDAAAADPLDWYDTNSRLNNITASGTYRLHITDPIVRKVRARIVKNVGDTIATFTCNWLSDREIELN